jgi:Na+/H+-translocating membrane pyrophosphatase
VVIGAFVALAATDRATNIITGLAVIGHASNVIAGKAVSIQAAALAVTVIAADIWIAYSVGGELYVVALAAAVMLAMDSIVVARNSYDPFTDTADGVAGMAELAHEVRALPLVVIGAFVSLAATDRALDLSALIGLLMLIAIVVTNAIVCHGIAQAQAVCTQVGAHGRLDRIAGPVAADHAGDADRDHGRGAQAVPARHRARHHYHGEWRVRHATLSHDILDEAVRSSLARAR